MLAWPWRVTSGRSTANTLIRANDSVLGTHKIRFNATSRSCRRTFDRESPGRQDYSSFGHRQVPPQERCPVWGRAQPRRTRQ